MTTRRPARRAAPRWWGRLAVLLLGAVLPAVASAQVRPDTVRRDTLRRDSVRVAIPPSQMEPDTLPADSVLADSAVAVPVFPRFPRVRRTGWAYGRWEWDRDALLRYHGLSVLGLLEQVPGLVVTRAGDFGAPAGIGSAGTGGARLRVFIDGWELDTPGSPTLDLQQIGLVDLESVRVERRLDGVRVELIPVRLDSARPISIVEAGTGNYDAKLLRALLMRGVGGRSILSGAYDLASTRGFGFRAPAAVGAGRLSWSYALGPQTVLQAEYRGETFERSGAANFATESVHRTVLLRGRTRVGSALTLDAMLGRVSRTPQGSDTLTTLPLASVQGAVRAALELPTAALEAGVRGRSGSMVSVASAPFELFGAASARPLPWLDAGAEVSAASLAGKGGLSFAGTVRAGGGSGPAAFATLSGGRRGLALVEDSLHLTGDEASPDTLIGPAFDAVSTSTAALRVGGEWVQGGAVLGLSGVALAAGTVVPFGLRFDRGAAPLEVEAASGVEGRAILPLPGTRGAGRLESSLSVWPERGGRPYLPQVMGRAALAYHSLFYDGQFEPALRVGVEYRGRALAPDGEGGFTAETEPYAVPGLTLQLRILDVRAWLMWENFVDYRRAADIPGLRLPGARVLYGVHWTFRN